MTEETKQPAELQPSIGVLKTGDKLITIPQEVFEGEGEERKGICLVMNFPYELELTSVPNPDDPARDLQVKFSKWCPYSIDNQYRIPYDGVLTIGVPDPGLAQAYRAKVDQQEDKNSAAQREAIEEAVGGSIPNTAGVGANTDEHPIAEPFQQVQEEPAITPEVV